MTAKQLLPRISWPHVAALAVIVAGVAAVLILAPDTTTGYLLRIIVSAMGLAGGAGTAASSGVVRDEPAPPRELPPRPMPPTRKRSGHAEAWTYGAIAVAALAYAAGRSVWHLVQWLGLVAVIVVALPGCAQAVKVASVLEPVGRVSCAIARKVVTVCDVAFPDTAPDGCATAGDETPAP